MDASVVDESDAVASDPDARSVQPEERAAVLRRVRRALPGSTDRTQQRHHRLGRDRTQARARRRFLRPPVHGDANVGRPTHGRPHAGTHEASGQHVLRGCPGEGQPISPRHRRRVHAAQLDRHVEPAARSDPGRTAPGASHLPRAGHQRGAGHRRVSVGCATHLRRTGQRRTRRSARSTPTTTSSARGRAARRPIPSPNGSQSGGVKSPRSLRSRRQGHAVRCTRSGLARYPLLRRG